VEDKIVLEEKKEKVDVIFVVKITLSTMIVAFPLKLEFRVIKYSL
jgi:hypothetical protein